MASNYIDYIIEQTEKAESKSLTVIDILGSPTLLSAAESGDIRAQYELGMKNLVADSSDSILWFRKAAAQGHTESQFYMGGFYLTGEYVNQDYEKSFDYMNSCSKTGSPKCTFYVGYFYEHGLGVIKVNQAVAQWFYEEAANGGYEKATQYISKE